MSVEYREHPQERYVETVIHGGISKADIDRIMPQMRAFLAAHGSIGVLQIVRGLGIVNMPAALPHLGTAMAALPKIRRAALVTSLPWLAGLTRASAAVSPIPTRVFGLTDEAAARAWLTET